MFVDAVISSDTVKYCKHNTLQLYFVNVIKSGVFFFFLFYIRNIVFFFYCRNKVIGSCADGVVFYLFITIVILLQTFLFGRQYKQKLRRGRANGTFFGNRINVNRRLKRSVPGAKPQIVYSDYLTVYES